MSLGLGLTHAGSTYAWTTSRRTSLSKIHGIPQNKTGDHDPCEELVRAHFCPFVDGGLEQDVGANHPEGRADPGVDGRVEALFGIAVDDFILPQFRGGNRGDLGTGREAWWSGAREVDRRVTGCGLKPG